MINIPSQLAFLNEKNLLRRRCTVSARHEKMITIHQQSMINFAGNDYLGLAEDTRVKNALMQGAGKFGFGSGSSAMISGYSSSHQELEEAFAAFLGRERALLFNSGYHANLGVITSFANRNTSIIADKHCHASLIDAMTLARSSLFRYRHNDIYHASELLQQQENHSRLLVTESVFSMTGAVTAADTCAAIASSQRAMLVMDDAHGFGVLGKNGRGICEHFNLSAFDVPILVTPLGKALGGMGAIVSGCHEVIEILLQKARTYCYSTALPPALCSAALQALHIIQSEPWRTARLQTLSSFFNHHAALRKLVLIAPDITPIKCILSGSNQRTIALQNILRTHGMYIAAIRPPTVAENSARLRISLNIHHTENDILQLLDVLAESHHQTASG